MDSQCFRRRRSADWYPESDEGDEESDDGTSSEGESQTIVFEELYDVETTLYDPNVLDLGVRLEISGPEDESKYPETMTMSCVTALFFRMRSSLRSSKE